MGPVSISGFACQSMVAVLVGRFRMHDKLLLAILGIMYCIHVGRDPTTAFCFSCFNFYNTRFTFPISSRKC